MDITMPPLLAALLLSASTATGAGEFPVQGGYGFDALKPTTTTYHHITAQEAVTFTRCEFSADGYAFGLSSRHYQCDALP